VRSRDRLVGSDDSILGRVSTDRLDGVSELANEKITGLERKPDGLFLDGFHRHKSHGGSGRRFPDCLGIGSVILIPFYEGLHVDRCDKSGFMSECAIFPEPSCALASIAVWSQGFDGAISSNDSKDALWARVFMGAPQRQRHSAAARFHGGDQRDATYPLAVLRGRS
jgi:hypothetical protein